MNLTSENIIARKLQPGELLKKIQVPALNMQKIENFIYLKKQNSKAKAILQSKQEAEFKSPLSFLSEKKGLAKKLERHLKLVALAKAQNSRSSEKHKNFINEISAKLIEESKEIEERVQTRVQVFSLVLDWFSANLKGEVPELSLGEWLEVGEFSIQLQKYGTKHFDKLALILHDGKPLGEIRYSPRSSEIIDSNTVMFKAENSMLYQNNFYELFEKFFTTINLKFSHINKLDLASDGIGFMKPLILANEGKIDWTNKRGKFQPFKKNSRIGLEYEGFWLGSKRKGDKYGRCYLKKQEIEISGKTYIENFWRENELYEKTQNINIERLEFSLRNKEISKYLHREMSWKEVRAKLEDKEFLASLFNTVAKSLFGFREKKKTGLENVSRLKKYFELDFSCYLMKGVKLLKAVVNIGTKRLRSLKTTCKVMYELGLKTSMKYYKNKSIEIAQNINHFHWFEKRVTKWNDEYFRTKRKNLEYIPIYNGESNIEFSETDSENEYKISEKISVIKELISFWNKPQFKI